MVLNECFLLLCVLLKERTRALRLAKESSVAVSVVRGRVARNEWKRNSTGRGLEHGLSRWLSGARELTATTATSTEHEAQRG